MNNEPLSAVAVLRRAADLIEQRAAMRVRPGGEKSMAATVEAFNAIYGERIAANGGRLDEVMGWHFMEILKMVRSAYGVYVPDDYEDKTAYAALAAEAASSGLTQICTRPR